jgi:Flp pilus assembly pilin Flp
MPVLHPRLSQAFPAQRGVAAVEFAFLAVLLIVLVAGLIEFGRGLGYYDALAKGCRDAARYLSAVPASQLSGAVDQARQRVLDSARAGGVPAFDAGAVEVHCAPVACTALSQPGDIREVQVAVRYAFTLGGWFPAFWTLEAGGGGRSLLTLAPRATMPYLW